MSNTEKNKKVSSPKESKSPDKVVDVKNKFQSRFYLEFTLNRPVFKIFSDYFNILNEDKALQEKHGIKVLGLLRGTEFRDTMNLYESMGERQVILQYVDGLVLNLHFEIYKQDNRMIFYFAMSSNNKTYIDSEAFYDKLWKNAVEISDLKGSYFEMERDHILWTKKKLEKREFSDIYLPSSTVEDLKLYTATNVYANRLMRYLMVGNPGTGKTESTLVLANTLNKEGVTIIKTPVCEMIKEKVQLAKLLAPSLIIFDDIDLSLGSRKHGVYSERLQDFLDVLDGTEKLPDNVGLIATTNSVALLDLAAQRPGRFDKVLSFDDLTSDNIKNIILKSLKYCFKVPSTAPIAKLFTNPKIIKLFRDTKVTGAHIFNSVKMLKLRMDLLKIKADVETIYNELGKEIKTIEKIRAADYLSDKLNTDRKSIGFGSEEEECQPDTCVDKVEELEIPKRLSKSQARDMVIKDNLFKNEG